METIKTKAYIIKLKYGIWENQLWLEAADTPAMQLAFEKAKGGLGAVADNSQNSSDFYAKAIEHFASFGFDRIQK
ncbi:MAG: hypothetical protein IKT78_02505 [Ruminiclostridium sp.]|nr:hypothetical protein [Ruminiclostridium sp.]